MICRTNKVPYAINITGLGAAVQKGDPLKELIKILLFRSKIVKKEQTCKWNGVGITLDEYMLSKYSNEYDNVVF